LCNQPCTGWRRYYRGPEDPSTQLTVVVPTRAVSKDGKDCPWKPSVSWELVTIKEREEFPHKAQGLLGREGKPWLYEGNLLSSLLY
jgi:hypothetical protein